MKKYIIFFLLVIAVLLIGGVMMSRRNQPSVYTKEPTSTDTKPWVEIITPKIMSSTTFGTSELQTGDEVLAGSQIQTGDVGLGNIYLTDGSVARVDVGTKINIEQEEYDQGSQKVGVVIKLVSGRVWTKVFGLVTPDSVWQIKTSNAVATVRGTALGVEYINGQTRIIGSKGLVSVSVLDPKTGAVVKDSAVSITPNTTVIIKNSDVAGIASGKIILATKTPSIEFLNESWVSRSVSADEKLDTLQSQLQSQGLSGNDLREAFKKQVKQNFIDANPPVQTDQTTPAQNTTVTSTDTSATGVTSPTNKIPKSLRLTTKSSFVGVTEGDQIPFVLSVVYIDRTSKVLANSSAVWSVAGLMGSVSGSGIFTAKLDPTVSELGESAGYVAVVWTDPTTKTEFKTQSPTFTVYAAVDTTPINTQGQ
ncbi:MAG: FecR family protein [bacterium]